MGLLTTTATITTDGLAVSHSERSSLVRHGASTVHQNIRAWVSMRMVIVVMVMPAVPRLRRHLDAGAADLRSVLEIDQDRAAFAERLVERAVVAVANDERSARREGLRLFAEIVCCDGHTRVRDRSVEKTGVLESEVLGVDATAERCVESAIWRESREVRIAAGPFDAREISARPAPRCSRRARRWRIRLSLSGSVFHPAELVRHVGERCAAHHFTEREIHPMDA